MRKSDDLTTFIVPKVEKIRSLNFRIPKGMLRPVAGKLYLYHLWRVCVRAYIHMYTHTLVEHSSKTFSCIYSIRTVSDIPTGCVHAIFRTTAGIALCAQLHTDVAHSYIEFDAVAHSLALRSPFKNSPWMSNWTITAACQMLYKCSVTLSG